MQEMYTIEEVKAVIRGFEYYVREKMAKEQKIFCHPIEQFAFMPTGIRYIKEDWLTELNAFQLFVTSFDGVNWSSKIEEMIQTVLSGKDFYIANLTVSVYLSVEAYMLEELLEILTTPLESIAGIYEYKWKPTSVGKLAHYSLEEYFSK